MKMLRVRNGQNSSKKSKLLMALICYMVTGTIAYGNGSMNTQVDVDALLLSNGGTVTHTVDEANGVYSSTYVAYPILSNIYTNATSLNVSGNTANKANLTFTGTYNGTKNVIYRSINNGVANKSIDFSNLKSLTINAPFTTANKVLTATGLLAYYGGSINVDSTVDKLDINLQTTVDKQALGIEAAGPTSSINILSPVVNVTMDGGDEDSMVTSDAIYSDNSTINLGNGEHPLTSLILTNTGTGGGQEGAIRSETSNDYPSNTKGVVNIIAKNIDIENWKYGLRANGYFLDKRIADINIGDAEHYADKLTIGGANVKPAIALHALYYGKEDIYAKKVELTAESAGISSWTDSIVRLHTGSNDGEGLVITSAKKGIYSAKPFVGEGEGSEVSVLSGNVEMKDVSIGVQAGYGNYGTVNLGTPDNPLNKVNISSNKCGVLAYGGDAHVYGRTVSITGPLATCNNPLYGGTTDIQGDQVNLTGDIGTYSGATKINDAGGNGTTVIVGNVDTGSEEYGNTVAATADISLNTANSYLQGYIKDNAKLGSTTLNASNSSTWRVTEDSNLDTLNLTSGGTVDMSYINGYQSVTTKNLKGNGSVIVFDTELQTSADNKDVLTNSDKLYITESSSGTHTIKVRDHSASLATDGYLLLVQDSSANPGAIFTADASITNGGLFAYKGVITSTNPSGYANVPAGSKNWYLTLDKTPPEPPAPPEPPTPPEPTYNAFANVGFAENRYIALFNEQDTLLKRLGELRNNRYEQGLWTRIRRGNTEVNSGYAGNGQFTTLQLGYDKNTAHTSRLDRYWGVAFDHTNGNQDYTDLAAHGEYSADTLTLYNTALYNTGHYWDAVGKIGKIRGNFDLNGDFSEYADAGAWYYSLSGEYGRKKTLGDNGWYLEPQAQLTYSHLNGTGYTSTQGTSSELDAIDSLILRAGTTWGWQREHGMVKIGNPSNEKNIHDTVYVKLFWNHEFAGDSRYYFYDKNDASLSGSHDYGSSWWTVGLGTSLVLGKNSDFHFDIERNLGGELTTKWLVNAGFRLGF
jgi:outer membrane autotransporter protein